MPTAQEIWTRHVNTVGASRTLASATTAQLAAVGSDINTIDKQAGTIVFNSTAGTVVVAVGPLVGDAWNNIEAGTSAHAPI